MGGGEADEGKRGYRGWVEALLPLLPLLHPCSLLTGVEPVQHQLLSGASAEIGNGGGQRCLFMGWHMLKHNNHSVKVTFFSFYL